MTPAQLSLYFEKAQEIKYDEFKMQAALHGAEIKDDPHLEGQQTPQKPANAKSGDTFLSDQEFLASPEIPFGFDFA